ncbi:MAG: tetrahydromethanopterin S-methyltransferase subunit MtrG [Candidatus Hecatellaceae archaeon]
MAEAGGDEEPVVPSVITPPEVSELLDRVGSMDEKMEFVLGEMALRRGLKVGTWIGILYGFTLGTLICIFLKFIVHWI